MIHSGTYLYIACDVCGRDEESLGAEYQTLYASHGEAVEAWDGNDFGPRPTPDGKALCWDCADNQCEREAMEYDRACMAQGQPSQLGQVAQ